MIGVITGMTIAYGILILLLLGTLINTKFRDKFFVMKTVCSLSFVILSFLYALSHNNVQEYKYVGSGFLLCFLGDIVLGIFNSHKNKKYFIVGAGLFLLAHVSFIIGLSIICPMKAAELIAPVLVLIFTYLLLRTNKFVLVNTLRLVIYVYSVFVSLLMAHGISMFIQLQTLNALLVMLGGILFFISDTLIVFLYFHRKRRWSTHGWNLATYYVAIALLIFGILS